MFLPLNVYLNLRSLAHKIHLMSQHDLLNRWAICNQPNLCSVGKHNLIWAYNKIAVMVVDHRLFLHFYDMQGKMVCVFLHI